MDESFFAALEAGLTNVGTDVYWKRKVGSIELWIAPLSMVGQGKVIEAITGTDGKGNVIGESKRITLSHSIVGFNEIDLRPYRDGVPAFPLKGRDGKQVNVSLDKYHYGKMSGWGAQFVDDAFAVYADLMESFAKENLKGVKFENAKDPREELAELMVKVTELRDQLGMPELVERGSEADQEPDADREPDGGEEGPDGPSGGAVDGPDAPGFDPFRQIPDRARHIAELEGVHPGDPGPPPVMGQAAPPPMQQVARIPAPVRQDPVRGPIHAAMPSVPLEVIEDRSPRVMAEPPPIDKPPSNVNPRFRPSGR